MIEKGVYAAALTPLNPNLSCADEILAEHCLYLINQGCKGVVLFGTTGEGPSFSVKEKKNTLKQVISKGLDPKKIIVGNGSASLADTIELAQTVLEYNCLGALIAPPCFFKNVSEEGVIAFYREILQQISDPALQIILYHIPQYSGVPLTVHIVQTLCREFPNRVIGIKESEGNFSFTQAILKTVPNCQVFVGKEKQLPLALQEGASGTICGIANLRPDLVCSLYEKGASLELDAFSALFEHRPIIACYKALLADKNPFWRFIRPPLTPLKEDEISKLKQDLALALKKGS
jgi:4-hydroxy-tetrahydrodipicolinate synthase